jgi:hypothetical protein
MTARTEAGDINRKLAPIHIKYIDSGFGTATGYGMDDRRVEVRVPVG